MTRTRAPIPQLPARALEPGSTLAATFGRRFAGVVLAREVVLRTEEMRRLLRRDYLHLARMLNTLAAMRSRPGADPAALNRLDAAVAAQITAVQALVAGLSAQLAERFARHPQAQPQAQHARPMAFQAPVASPHALHYLDVVAEADACLASAAAAWLQGLLHPQEYQALARQLRRAFNAVKAQVTQARRASLALLPAAGASATATPPSAPPG